MILVTRLLDVIDKTQRHLTTAFFFFTLVIVALQVFNRLLFQLPIIWTLDLSVFCFIWLAMLSASSSVRSSGHFRVISFIESIGFLKRWRFQLEIFAILTMITLSAVLMVYGTIFTLAGANEQSPGLAFSMVWSYISVPVCSFTALLFSFERLAFVRSDLALQGSGQSIEVSN